jgi:hypothetical protein
VLAKTSEEGDMLATGAGATVPVPVKLTLCGLAEVLSLTLNVPDRVPEDVGLKVTLMVQFAPAAIEEPQLSVSA